MLRWNLIVLLFLSVGCVTPRPLPTAATAVVEPALCEHHVPADTCIKCHPELIPEFKKLGDWCHEHDVPESQCLKCHPDMKFAVLPTLPPSADLKFLATMGQDVPDLASQAVPGKVTVFDFYADWCVACRKVDLHLYNLLAAGQPIALRRMNVMSWETPLAKRYLTTTPTLPLVIVYGRNGREVRQLTGVDPNALEDALAEAAR